MNYPTYVHTPTRTAADLRLPSRKRIDERRRREWSEAWATRTQRTDDLSTILRSLIRAREFADADTVEALERKALVLAVVVAQQGRRSDA